MTKFRYHRGSLADSMATAVEVEGRYGLFLELEKNWPEPVSSSEITIEPYGGIDHRIGWDTHIVKVDGIPVGFTDGPL